MRALIVLGGERPSRALLESVMRESELTIAADSGLAAFAESELVPDVLVGDMDSIAPELLAHYEGKLEERRLNCVKDDTDGVDALDLAISRGADRITLLGALGGRLDHAMANLMLLVRAHQKGATARVLDERVHIERVDSDIVLSGAKGDTVSLLPMGTARGVTLEGFFYPLHDHTLESSYPLGISNLVVQDEARVQVREGDLLMFHYYGGI